MQSAALSRQAYDEARQLLCNAGWQPRMQHWSHGSESDMTCGNGLYFWEKGFHEIMHASGAGLAHCAFGHSDIYGNRLVVVTAGEVIEEANQFAGVWSWHFEQEEVT